MPTEKQMIENMQPPPAYIGAHTDFDGPKRPPLSAPPITDDPPVKRGDRVEELGAFGAKTGGVGLIKAADNGQVVVKWDGGGSGLLGEQYVHKLETET